MIIIRRYIIVCLVFAATSGAFAQFSPGPNSPRPQHLFLPQMFIADPVIFYNKNNSDARLDLYISIPYHELQFLKDSESKEAGDIYSANIQYEIILKTRLDSIITNEAKEIKINEKYNSKIFKAGSKILVKNYELPTGKYILNITVTDLNTQMKYSSQYNIEAENNSGKEIYASDMLLLKNYLKDSEGKASITPMIINDVGRTKNYFIFMEVYNSSGESLSKELTYTFRTNSGNVIKTSKQSYSLQPGTNTLVEKFSSLTFDEDSFVLEVNDPSGKVISTKHLINRPLFKEPQTKLFPPQL